MQQSCAAGTTAGPGQQPPGVVHVVTGGAGEAWDTAYQKLVYKTAQRTAAFATCLYPVNFIASDPQKQAEVQAVTRCSATWLVVAQHTQTLARGSEPLCSKSNRHAELVENCQLQLARVKQLVPVPRTRTGQVSAQELPQVHEPVLVDALLQRLSVHG